MNEISIAAKPAEEPRKELSSVVIRFAGDSGDGIQLTGSRFTETTALAGNDLEWRYVPVRMLYLTVEKSIKKALEPMVFENNDAITWLRVKNLVSNYLISLWRQGALNGTSPQEAFFVNVGLNESMNSTDILEGRMNVEIGIAAVRPAEFMELKLVYHVG